MNTSVNASTGMSPFLILYSVHPQTIFTSAISSNLDAETLFKDPEAIWNDAANTIKTTQAKMKIYWDAK